MKHLPNIAATLLGLAFLTFGLDFFLSFIPKPEGGPPEGSPPALFFGAVYATGFLAFVKILEILGGVFVIIPKTRNLGLLLLGPIVVGILAFNLFIAGGSAIFQPPVILISLLAAYVLFTKRASWLTLLKNES
ncbi:hypothetical protein [Roseibacillus ishigakijimensis]|uniref:DoxX-like family protein n=1 Tax=Roseibacillus ishigakijimensis TaxID=454146 RepID=A0A934RSN0_9BACT|nr:hypothetical protein [Roseibacillus ishigakijimensis]MBK1835182.1 hypothetical protein [Roseibacillus ishigakijimensis]